MRHRFILVIAALAGTFPSARCLAQEPVRALLLTGQSNHDWHSTAPVLADVLETQGGMAVATTEHPETLTAPELAPYAVLISHWNAWGNAPVGDWPEATREAVLGFVRGGGGFVVVHAGSSSFYDWDDYQALTLATWKLGQTGHGPRHAFRVKPTAVEHPVTRGLPPFWTYDELWHRAGVQPGATAIATAFSSVDRKGTGSEEPIAFIGEFGKGRCFTLLLGHDVQAMANPGWRELVVRGTQWAARRDVSASPPGELPTSAALALASRVTRDELLDRLAAFGPGTDRRILSDIETRFAATEAGSDAQSRWVVGLTEIAASEDATALGRGWALRLLGRVTSEIPVGLAPVLIRDPDLCLVVCEVLQRTEGADATRALVEALRAGQTADPACTARALGSRDDPAAVPALATGLGADDRAFAVACGRALGDIGGAQATAALLKQSATEPAVVDLADALLRALSTLPVDEEEPLRTRCVEQLRRPRWPPRIQAAAWCEHLAMATPVGTGIESALSGADSTAFSGALRFLRRAAGDPSLVAAADSLAGLDDPRRQVALISVLADRGVIAAEPRLLPLLEGPGPVIRAVLDTLSRLGGRRAVLPLCERGSGEHKRAIRDTLARLPGEGVDAELLRVLEEETGPLAAVAVQALADRRCAAAVPAFLAVAEAKSTVADVAYRAVGELGDMSAARVLLERRCAAGGAASAAALERALSVLVARLPERDLLVAEALARAQGADPPVRAGLLTIVGGVRTPAVCQALTAALEDAGAGTRRVALRALAEWPEPAPLPALLAVAADAASEADRVLALRAVASVAGRSKDDTAAVGALERGLTLARRTDTRKALLGAVAGKTSMAALRLALEYVPIPDTREEALGAALALAARCVNTAAREERAELAGILRYLERCVADSERKTEIQALVLSLNRPPNLALAGTATSPDGHEKDGAAGGDQAAIDGNPDTYWDEENGQSEYRLRVTFDAPITASAISILGYTQHGYSARDFQVVCDDAVVATVEDAQYTDRELWVSFERRSFTWLELRITRYYSASPAVRELGIYDGALDGGQEGDAEMVKPDSQAQARWNWEENEEAVTLRKGGLVVWRFESGEGAPKPAFHPLGLADGRVLSGWRPADHPWHRGLWFSWKFINGVNYWEEDRTSGVSAGRTRILERQAELRDDGSAVLTLDIDYTPADGEPVLRETRRVVVSTPDAQGGYRMDWDMTFRALEDAVRLDRTPIPGEPGGKGHGGYAGLSFRAALDSSDWRVDGGGGVEGMALHRSSAPWARFHCGAVAGGGQGGVVFFDHPANTPHPTPWFVVINPGVPFGYLSPAPLCLAPKTLARDETYRLRYRVWVYAGAPSLEAFEREWKRYSE